MPAALPRCLLLLLGMAASAVRADQEPPDFAGMLATHNAARQAVGTAPLIWSNALAESATRWASQLSTEGCQLRYDPDPRRRESTGQNLFRATAPTIYEGYQRNAVEASARWVGEGEHYDRQAMRCATGLGSRCGAYLQVVWQATTALGCGRARCPQAEVWVCDYEPRGGQDDQQPYGNTPRQSPAAAIAPPVQQCGEATPSEAQRFGEALNEKLLPKK